MSAPAAPQRTPNWCERHWAPVRDGIEAGTHNGIVASLELVQRFINRIYELKTQGRLERRDVMGLHGPTRNVTMQRLVAERSPICCWLGDEAVEEVYALARQERAS